VQSLLGYVTPLLAQIGTLQHLAGELLSITGQHRQRSWIHPRLGVLLQQLV